MKQALHTILALLLAMPAAWAADLSITIGSPIAVGALRKVAGATLAVRLDHCTDASQARLSAVAEGIVNGARRNVELKTQGAAQQPGAFVVIQDWPPEGQWLVRLNATCGAAKAGALVPFSRSAFQRDSAKFFTRFVTPAEVEAALKAETAAAAP